jgi:cytochrome c553
MARVIIVICFVLGLSYVFSLSGYKSLKVKNEKYDIKKLEKIHAEQIALMNPKKSNEDSGAKAGGLEAGKLVYMEKGKCHECHGANGEGNVGKNAPIIAGQFDWYVLLQLQTMKSGVRYNEDMKPYLEALNDADLKAVSKYVGSLAWPK